METKKYLLKTDNLKMIPMSLERMKELGLPSSLIERCEIEDSNYLYLAYWDILLCEKYEKEKVIGSLHFTSEPNLGKVELIVELDKEYRNKGYGTNVIKAVTEYCFAKKDIYTIMAKADMENDSAISALNKSGFVYRSHEGHTEFYTIEKQATQWMGLYVIIGLFAGFFIGVVLSNMYVGVAIGVFVGIGLGAAMDGSEDKKRESITGEKRIKKGLIRKSKEK